MREGFDDLCEPHCRKGCINGFCNEPNVCEFEDIENETNIDGNYTVSGFEINSDKNTSGVVDPFPISKRGSFILTLPIISFFVGVLVGGLIVTLIFMAILHFVSIGAIKGRLHIINP